LTGNWRASAFVLALVSSGLVVVGCSESDEGPRQATSGEVHGPKVLSLEQGASVDDVVVELGEPVSEFTDEEVTALHYLGDDGVWHLTFEDGRLRVRARERRYHSAHAPHGRALDRDVLGLHPGMTIRAVESRLGKPQVYEEEFEGAPRPREVFRYGVWELSFSNGRLTFRTKG
jgi:hypothetical protein